MKKRISKLIIVLLIMTAVSAVCGCESINAALSETTEALTEPPVVTESDTEASVPVIAEPDDTSSRGLTYVSNGDGTCTLTGMGSCTDTVIIIPETSDEGETVTKIAAGAFEGNTAVTAVQIPAGIVEIGARAFSGCPALSYITVDGGNANYTDMGGVLYTADETRLLCLPAGSSYISITLTKKVKQIAEGATDGCVALKKVIYEGSREDWKTVNVASKNAPFSAAEMTYMTASGK